MKIVRIIGGLGNQMFQYALALSLRQRFPSECIKIDTSLFNGYPLHNGFEIDQIFGSNFERARFKDIIKIGWPLPHYRLWQVGSRILPSRKSMCVERSDYTLELARITEPTSILYDGYWQSGLYFKEYRAQILDAFSFPEFKDENNIGLLNLLQSKKTVSIHIRRGDYVQHPFFKDICTISYYKNAIKYIRNNAEIDLFCIFSNDIQWVKNNFSEELTDIETVFVDWNKGNDSFRDMQLMSVCNHNIIANSSFSWWGAWLNNNKDKIVVAPYKWMNKDLKSTPICESWIKISDL